MYDLVDWFVDALPSRARRLILPTHIRLLTQMLQFGCVGVAGFVVDTAFVYLFRGTLGLYVSGTLAYGVAVTTTWWLNRVWTFRGIGRTVSLHSQWIRFALANLPGFCLNLGTYFALVYSVPVCADHPVLPVAAGALAGMTANFILSRSVVFR